MRRNKTAVRAVSLLTAAGVIGGMASLARGQETGGAAAKTHLPETVNTESAPRWAILPPHEFSPQNADSTVSAYLLAQQESATTGVATETPQDGEAVSSDTVESAAEPSVPATMTGFGSESGFESDEEALTAEDPTAQWQEWQEDTETDEVSSMAFPSYVEAEEMEDPAFTPTYPVDESTEMDLELTPEPLTRRWDFARLDGELFGTEELTEYSRRQIPVDGNWNIRPHFSLATYYDGNIFISDEDQQGDFVVRAAPGVSFRIGDGRGQLYVTGDYTVGFVAYSNNKNEDFINQDGNLNVQWTLPKTTLGLHLGILAESGTDIDVTDLVRRTIYYAGITSNHIVSDKTSFDLNLDYRYTDYRESDLISSKEARVQTYFNYEILPKVSLGVGGVIGVLDAPPNSNQTYVSPSLRAIWVATGKVTLNANLGVDIRQVDGGTRTSPVFGIEGIWRIRNGTELTLNARRGIYSSAVFSGQDYAATGVTAGITQRMTDRCSFVLTGGYENLDYESAEPDVDASRVDNYFFVRPAIRYRVTDWFGVGLFYEYSRNNSRGAGARSFRRDRGGLQLNFIY